MTGSLTKPLAARGEVAVDPVERTLMVKPAKGAGWAGLLWRRGHQQMVEQAGSFGEPVVMAHGVGRGTAEMDGWLRFRPDPATFRRLTASEPEPPAPDVRRGLTF